MNPKPGEWYELVDVVAIEREREDRRRQLREAQQRIAALEAENQELFSRSLRRLERIETLDADAVYAGRAIEHYQSEVLRAESERDNTRRAAAARLRAVKRMKRVARHYQLLALRLAVGAELADVAEAAQRDAARAAGRGE